MLSKLRHYWEQIRASFWLVPTVIVLGAVGLATGLIALAVGSDVDFEKQWPLLFGTGAAGSRGLLTAVASSMITVAGVVFSITIVALSLTSSQYTSRVLRNFMRDRMNQAVLGVFLGVFAYCLVVLRTIRDGEEGAFVPSLAVLGGLVLAFVGTAFLIYFIHHIAMSIQASTLIAAAAEETVAAVDRFFPKPCATMPTRARTTIQSSRLSSRVVDRRGKQDRLYREHRRRLAADLGTQTRNRGPHGARHRRICRRGCSAAVRGPSGRPGR